MREFWRYQWQQFLRIGAMYGKLFGAFVILLALLLISDVIWRLFQ